MNNNLQDQLAEIFASKYRNYNEDVLEELGKIIKQFKGLSINDALQLKAKLLNDKNYIKLLNQLGAINNTSYKEIENLVEEIINQNINQSSVFFKARNIETPTITENIAIKNIMQNNINEMINGIKNISMTTGFRLLDANNNPLLLDFNQTYTKVIDDCVNAVVSGDNTSLKAIKSTINQLVDSGVRKIDYNTGYSQRIDTAVRRNILDGMRKVSNEIQEELGNEFNADGVEISVHMNPAPDHEHVQGRQFSNEQYAILNSGLVAKDYKGNEYTLDHDNKNGYRPISTMNCYHYEFRIILGVSEPLYSDEKLKEIRQKNDKGCEIDGNKYTMYQATQLQRQYETEIRKAKDKQIISVAMDNKIEILKQQMRITQLTTKYKQICAISGLPNKLNQRARVRNYKRTKV